MHSSGPPTRDLPVLTPTAGNSDTSHEATNNGDATNKVTPNIKTTIITNPSLTDCIDESEGSNEELNEFESFMSKLKGKSKKHFGALLEQLGEANDMIKAHEIYHL